MCIFCTYFICQIQLIGFKYHNKISDMNSVLTNILDLGLHGAGTVVSHCGHVRNPEGTLKCDVGKTLTRNTSFGK